MCNEYARELEARRIIRFMEEMKHIPPFSWTGGKIPNDQEPKASIKIRDKGFVCRFMGEKLQGEMMTWAWKTPHGKPVFNFISEKRDFSKSDRLLIPATGFYEYTAPENPKVKLKDQHYFTLKGEAWFWIVGIEKQDCFAMLTTSPGTDMKPYHDRQICILPPDAGMDWLRLAKPEEELLAPLKKGSLKVETRRRNGEADCLMARKLKTYVTSVGFFDLAVAAPSMKAALETWGSTQNLFHQGFAEETDDPEIIAATMAKPGVVLRRAVGTKGVFKENAELPKSLPATNPARSVKPKPKPKSRKTAKKDEPDAKAQKAAIIGFEQERAKRQRAREKEEAERQKEEAAEAREEERRQKAVDKAEAIRDRARERHDANMADLEKQRDAIEGEIEAERKRWQKEEAGLDGKLREATRS